MPKRSEKRICQHCSLGRQHAEWSSRNFSQVSLVDLEGLEGLPQAKLLPVSNLWMERKNREGKPIEQAVLAQLCFIGLLQVQFGRGSTSLLPPVCQSWQDILILFSVQKQYSSAEGRNTKTHTLLLPSLPYSAILWIMTLYPVFLTHIPPGSQVTLFFSCAGMAWIWWKWKWRLKLSHRLLVSTVSVVLHQAIAFQQIRSPIQVMAAVWQEWWQSKAT